MVGQLDPAYSSMEKKGPVYVPSVAEYGKKRRTTRNISYAAGCICGVGLAVWMVYITLLVNKDVGMRDQPSLVLGGPNSLNNSGLYMNIQSELEAMKNILEHMTEEKATSILEANPNEMQRRTAEVDASPSNLQSFLGDLEFKQEKNAWLKPDESVHYISFFSEDSRPLEEKTTEERGNHIKRAEKKSWTKLNIERLPSQKQNKEFIFSLIFTRSNCLEITTASGRKAAASGDYVLLEPADITATTTTTTTTTISTTTSTTRNSSTTTTTTTTPTTPTTTTTTTKTTSNSTSTDWTTTMTTTLAPEAPGSSCWLLSKRQDRFLIVESATNPGKFWNTKGPTGNLVLSEDPELFTGINTNFIKEVFLERSNNYEAITQPSTRISEDMTGDIKIRYLDRYGRERTGYVCDNEWGYDDAASACKHLFGNKTGIPTYDGRFSEDIYTRQFAMSGVSCGKEDAFLDCRFKTECSDSTGMKCLAQRSMRLLDGKGFGCNIKDAAGVVCGTKEQIEELKIEETETLCNGPEIASSKMSIGQIASLENQANEVSDVMTKNKHWSEFLLPLPMTVSLISMLMLISAQYEGKVELQRPPKGEWEEMKWDLLTPNLYDLNGKVTDAFDRSTTAMKIINMNSRSMNTALVSSIKWAATPCLANPCFAKTKLKRSFRDISKFAKRNFFEADETIKLFEGANRFIQELLEAMKNSQMLQEDEKQKLSIGLELMKDQTNRDQGKLAEEKANFEKYKIDVKTTRDELYDAAKAIESSSCEMDSGCLKEGSRTCDECLMRPARFAKDLDGNKICERRNMTCTERETYCEVPDNPCIRYGDGGCLSYEEVCVKETTYTKKSTGAWWWHHTHERGTMCAKKETKCTRKNPQVCVERTVTCKKKSERCKTEENMCKEWRRLPAGSFCKLRGVGGEMASWGGCCSACAGRDETKKILGKILQASMMLDIKSLEDDSNIEIIHSIVEVTLEITSKIDKKVNPMPNHKSKRSIEEKTSNQTKEETDKGTLESEIQTFVLSLPLQNKQLDQIAKKNPLANEAKSLLRNFQQVISNIDVSTPASTLSTSQKESIQVANAKITTFAATVAKEAKKHEIDLDLSSINAPAGLSEKAEAYLENKKKRLKSSRLIESLSQNLESALAQMAANTIDMNDLKTTINYLISCAEYLTQLKVAWGSIKDFFSSLAAILETVKTNALGMDENLGDIFVFTSISISDVLDLELQKTTVDATAYNIFTKKVSSFYVTIMETGLLDKIRGLNFNRLTPGVFQETKEFILREARTMQKRISDAVSAEQAELNNELNKKMWSIQKKMCDLGQTELLDSLKDKQKQVEMMEETLSYKVGLGIDDENLKKAGILENKETLASQKGGTFDMFT